MEQQQLLVIVFSAVDDISVMTAALSDSHTDRVFPEHQVFSVSDVQRHRKDSKESGLAGITHAHSTRCSAHSAVSTFCL